MNKSFGRRHEKWHSVKIAALSLAALAAFVVTLTEKQRIDQLVKGGRDQLSKLMRLEQIEWEEVGSGNLSRRVTKELLLSTSGLKLGQEMMPIALGDLETRLMSIPWIESVQIQKKLPSTLVVRYTTHSARALGIRHGRLWSVSDSGRWIAPFDRGNSALDLPVLASEESLEAELAWLNSLENGLGRDLIQIHEVNIARMKGSELSRAEALVELQYPSQTVKLWIVGAEHPDAEALNRLKRVVRYLIKNNVLVSNIDLRLGKKVVVNVGKRP